jgi:hypothetical protein
MKLLDTLIKKRDYYLAMAGKFSELIAVVQGDEDFAKHTHSRKVSIMDGALAQLAANGNGNDHTPVEPSKPKGTQTPEFRARQSRRMKKLWKEKRALMLRGTRKGQKKSVVVRLANKKARQQAQA